MVMIYVIIATTKQRRKRLEECLAALRESTVPHAVVTYENSDGGCCKPTRDVLEGIKGTIFIINDDMIVEPDCLQMLDEAYRINFPNKDGICQPFETIHKGQLGVSPFGDRDYILPYLDKGYVHSFWDTEITMMSQAYGKYVMVPEAKMEHVHPVSGKAVMDETYHASQAKAKQDETLFRQRMAKKFI